MEQKIKYHVNNYYVDTPVEFEDIWLYQIGRKYSREGDVTPSHVHSKLFEITIVTGGSATIITNGKRFRLTAGYNYLSFPYEIHEIHADQGEHFEYDFFAFYPKNDNFIQAFEQIMEEHNGPNLRTFANDKIRTLVNFALSEFPLTPTSTPLLNDLFHSILIYIIREFSGKTKEQVSVSNPESLCFQAMNYIDTHLFSITTTKTVCDRLNYNYSYFSSLFKQTTGKSLSDYLRTKKLQSAKLMLISSKKNVTEVASVLNYSTPFAFTKAFKKEFGISPKEYVKRKKGKV